MLGQGFVFATLLALVASEACKHTPTQLNITQCDPTAVITFDPSKASMVPYPPTADQPIHIDFTFNNTGTKEFTKVNFAVNMEYYYGNIIMKCDWHKIPLPTIKLDGCKLLSNCPIKTGVAVNDVKIDLTPFKFIIDKLPKNVYYRLTIDVSDGDTGNEISCVKAAFMTA